MMRTVTGRNPWRFALLVAGVLAGVVALGIWQFFGERNRKKEELIHYLLDHPETTAMAVYTFDESGDLVEDGSALFHNADTPFVMASTMKTVVLAAYADAVTQGVLDPQERVPVKELEKYYLPLTDGDAHKNGLASLGLRVDDAGFAADQAATIALDDIARIMIHYSGNAEMDYLLARLDPARVASVMQTTGLAHHTPIRPVLDVTLAIFNHENAAHPGTGTRAPEELRQLYLEDADWRAAQIAYIRSGKAQSSLDVQAAWMEQLGARGTAREYARMMARIASGTYISAQVSQKMQQMLERVPTDWPLRLLFYNRLGAKEGVTPGVLALASYMEPKHGPLAGKQRVTVLLLNRLPAEQWMAAVQAESHFLAQADLARGTWIPTAPLASE